MKYTDRVYGTFEINDPIILDLINSPEMQRLKKIDQGGYRALWVRPEADISDEDHSRFAHSVGVYLLLRKYDASLPEQISGLLHDVSHGAFSHCLDYVFSSGSETDHTHQDNTFVDFVRHSDIPKILDRHGLDTDFILDDANFPLKETKLPDLCADRIDYSLRTAILFGEISSADVGYFLDNLVTQNNSWVFKNFESAKKYAEMFRKINNIYYSDLSSAIMFRVVGDCLKYALEKKYISEADLYTDDAMVVDKIRGFVEEDAQLKILFDRMNNKTQITNNPDKYDATVFCKSRMINPFCLVNGVLKRIGEIDPAWEEIVKTESQPKKYFLRFAN